MRLHKRDGIVVGSRALFPGVIAEVLVREDGGEIQIVPTPSSLTPIVRTRQMIDLGTCLQNLDRDRHNYKPISQTWLYGETNEEVLEHALAWFKGVISTTMDCSE